MNIELVETSVLVSELLSRFQHAVFIGGKVRPLPDEPDKCDIFELIEFKGEHRACQGLTQAACAHIERRRESVQQPDEGDW